MWSVGDDWRMSEAEIAELEAQDYYYPSTSYGEVVVDEDGAIRAFDFGSKYKNLSLLRQLGVLLDQISLFSYHDATLDLTYEIRGSYMAVDVVMVETETVSDDSTKDGYRDLEPTRRVVGEFLYHPVRQVLTHRG